MPGAALCGARVRPRKGSPYTCVRLRDHRGHHNAYGEGRKGAIRRTIAADRKATARREAALRRFGFRP